MKISNGVKSLIKKITWEKSGGLVTAVIQDAQNGSVLMLGYMNREALSKTIKTKKVWFYSRSKKRLWMKGETSKNVLNLIDIKTDCDSDALLIKVSPSGPVCHTGIYSCFSEEGNINSLLKLFKVIQSRKQSMPGNSYTTSLFQEGLYKICVKVAEESGEVIKAATKESRQRLVEESIDLLYHVFVLMVEKGISLESLQKEIQRREVRPPL